MKYQWSTPFRWSQYSYCTLSFLKISKPNCEFIFCIIVGRKRKRGRKRLGRPPKSKSQGAQQEFPDGAVSASTNHVAPTSSPLVISQPPTLQQKNPILTLNLIPSAPNVQIGVSSGKQFTVPLLLNQRAPASVGTRGSSQLDRMVYTHPLVGVMGQLPVRPQAGQRSQLAAAASPQNTSQVKPIPSPNAKASPQPRAGATASPAGRQQSQPSAASAHVGTHRNSNVRFATAQNGISYPVTPPKTPENSAGSQSGASPGVVAVAPLPVVQVRYDQAWGQLHWKVINYIILLWKVAQLLYTALIVRV